MNVHPFFLVIDDGGRPYLKDGGQRLAITLSTYQLIADLATQFEMTIPIAYCFRYLDEHNLSGLGGALDYANELTGFILEYSEKLPFYHHGLTHGYDYVIDDGRWTATHAEFFDLDHSQAIPEIEQSWHLETCSKICRDLGLELPEVFVPPCHAWESGVTDRLVSSQGIKQLITVPKLQFLGKIYNTTSSDYLRVLPRKSLHISHDMTNDALDEELLRTMLRLVLPMHWFWRLRYYRATTDPWVHSYYVHITNFFPNTRDFWCRFFDAIRSREDLFFPNSTAEALHVFDRGQSSVDE